MIYRELLTDPPWREGDLGKRLPPSPHAVSVALPRWKDVIGYEEKDPAVLSRLECGYPRFVIHPSVQHLCASSPFSEGRARLPFPSEKTAHLCADFIRKQTGLPSQVLPHKGVFLVDVEKNAFSALKDFWQHTGGIVSSRLADAALAGKSAHSFSSPAHRSLQKKLAALYGCEAEDVFLVPTGMAAHFLALRAVQARKPHTPTAQLGFPYVDTLKLQQKIGAGAVLLGNLSTIAADLLALIKQNAPAACFCEIPGNPLLGSADLREISPLLKSRGIPLVADDVVATPFNVDLSPYADLVVTSLTKYIAGSCDVMGGALVCNPRSPFRNEFRAILSSLYEPLLYEEDAAILDERADSFEERMKTHNENGLFIAERLRSHPAVERVWFPKWEFCDAYESVRRPGGGWGSVVTFLPKNASEASPRIYDCLPLAKGPSLGSFFTLACPFTLLAHYTELDWAESCGVSRYLIRLSVGIETPETLWQKIEHALSSSLSAE